MTRIGIISDTHISEKRGKIHKKVFDCFSDVDLILHAGDITHQKVLDELNKLAPVTAVKGNNDKFDLETVRCIQVHNFKIVLTHGTELSSDFNKLHKFGSDYGADILITGHTHKSHHKIMDEMLLVNPGTARGANASIAILIIDEEDKLITDININYIEL